MPPRRKKTLAISAANLRVSTKAKLKKMKKPKRINEKLRDRAFHARCLHGKMEEAVKEAFQAHWERDHDDVLERLEEIQFAVEH